MSERLDVYQAALDFAVLANELVERLPRGRSHLSDQLTRASISIVLNIAEGAGKYFKPDKRRYYLSAAGSATESAILDICVRFRLIEQKPHEQGKALLDRVVAMLVRLASALE
ncbi:MAG: four helix bundle protein [Polyangiales bacterium]